MIRDNVRHTLRGECDLLFEHDGINCRIDIPLLAHGGAG